MTRKNVSDIIDHRFPLGIGAPPAVERIGQSRCQPVEMIDEYGLPVFVG